MAFFSKVAQSVREVGSLGERKSVLLAIILTWLFGPFGLIYVGKRTFGRALVETALLCAASFAVFVLTWNTDLVHLVIGVVGLYYVITAYSAARAHNSAVDRAAHERAFRAQAGSHEVPLVIRCRECGADIPDDPSEVRFCPFCGAQMATKCPSCGERLRALDKLCGHCGAIVRGESIAT